MSELNLNLNEEMNQEDKKKQAKLSAGLPSAELSRQIALAEKYRTSPRKQISFTSVPEIIINDFAAKAKKMGMTKKEFFYYCLGKGGIEIPEMSFDKRSGF